MDEAKQEAHKKVTMVTGTSLRSKLEQQERSHVTDARKASLFHMVDQDGSGGIDNEEFSQLYDMIKEETHKDLTEKFEAQREAQVFRRRVKLLGCGLGGMTIFLAISILCNAATVLFLLEKTKEVKTDANGMLVSASSSSALVKVASAQVNFPVFLAPRLSVEALSKVQRLTLGSPEGYRHYRIESFDWQNNMTMTFYTSRGDRIMIYRKSVVVDELALRMQNTNGSDHLWMACGGGSTTCSSLDVSGWDVHGMLAEFVSDLASDPALPNSPDFDPDELLADLIEGVETTDDDMRSERFSLYSAELDTSSASASSRRQLRHRRCRRRLETGDVSDDWEVSAISMVVQATNTLASARHGQRQGQRQSHAHYPYRKESSVETSSAVPKDVVLETPGPSATHRELWGGGHGHRPHGHRPHGHRPSRRLCTGYRICHYTGYCEYFEWWC